MTAWIDDVAERFGLQLSADTRARLLELARDVAHGTERSNAPLASYLVGRYVQRRVAEGADEASALGEATERARALLQPPRA